MEGQTRSASRCAIGAVLVGLLAFAAGVFAGREWLKWEIRNAVRAAFPQHEKVLPRRPAVEDLPPTTSPLPSPPKWDLEVKTSPMDGAKSVFVSKAANEQVAGFGGMRHTATLILRCRGNETEAFVSTGVTVERDFGSDRVNVRVKFDDSAADKIGANPSAMGDALFLPSSIALIKRMLAAKTLFFEFTPFQGGPETITFDLTGLGEVIGPLQAACGWK